MPLQLEIEEVGRPLTPGLARLDTLSAMNPGQPALHDAEIQGVRVGERALPGLFAMPAGLIGIVVFTHAAGSNLRDANSLFIANVLKSYRLGTLLFDLLTERECLERQSLLDIPFLGERLAQALHWLERRSDLAGIPIGLLGLGTGAAVALQAAAQEPQSVDAVVLHDGRPDLARSILDRVRAPTLLILNGQDDGGLVRNNRAAMRALQCAKRLAVIPKATDVSQANGNLDIVASLAAHWFEHHFAGIGPP